MSFLLAALSIRIATVSAQTSTLAEMQEIAWTRHDGAPLGIGAIAMGPEGLLYISTFTSIFRFDGTAFEPVPVHDVQFTSRIKGLMFIRNGDLVVSFHHGGPVVLQQGREFFLDRSDGPTVESIYGPQQTPSGQIWAVLNERELVTLGDDHVWHVAPDPGASHGHITRLFADNQGALWIVIDDRLFRRSPAGTFLKTSAYVYGDGTITPGVHGDLWITSVAEPTSAKPVRHLQHLDDLGNLLETRDIIDPLRAAAAATDGSLWLFTEQGLLAHLPPGELERQGRALVLAHSINQLDTRMADRGGDSFFLAKDGSVWIGGLSRIERFSRSMLVPLLPNATPGEWDACLESNGSQWILDPGSTLHFRTPDGRIKSKATGVAPVFCSTFGNLAENNVGLSVLEGGRLVPLPKLPGLRGFGMHYHITGATRTADGSVIAVAEGGAIGTSLWRYHAGYWQQLDAGQPILQITGLYATPQDAVYVGFRDGTAGVVESGSLRVRFVAQSGLNGIVGFASSSHGLFAYGVSGLALLRQDSFFHFPFADVQAARLVTGVYESSDGALWVHGEKGIVHVSGNEVTATLRDPSHRVLSTTVSEGSYNDPAMPRTFGRSVQADYKGRIWFNTLSGIVSIAPENLHNSEVPPLLVKSVLADGRPIPSNRELSAGVNSLNIRYVGVDFSDPTAVSYTYRLEGYDSAWQDVGTRTEAVYTHLRAGKYTFQVRARNSFGMWTPPVTLEPFVIQPHFYERRWFLASAVMLFASLVGLIMQLRLHIAASTFRRRANDRADERVSIARDLHDTLLQGVQGLLMTFHVATEGVPSDHEARPALEHALTSAEKLIIEGRDRVKGLRGANISGDELGQLFQSVADDLRCTDHFHLSVSPGTAKTILTPHVAGELFLIGRESIINAVRHAHALHIYVRLHYESRAFRFECEDDGVGFDPQAPELQPHQPRWGIPGIRERVEALGGTLQIRSKLGQGTAVRVLIRARFAYR